MLQVHYPKLPKIRSTVCTSFMLSAGTVRETIWSVIPTVNEVEKKRQKHEFSIWSTRLIPWSVSRRGSDKALSYASAYEDTSTTHIK